MRDGFCNRFDICRGGFKARNQLTEKFTHFGERFSRNGAYLLNGAQFFGVSFSTYGVKLLAHGLAGHRCRIAHDIADRGGAVFNRH